MSLRTQKLRRDEYDIAAAAGAELVLPMMFARSQAPAAARITVPSAVMPTKRVRFETPVATAAAVTAAAAAEPSTAPTPKPPPTPPKFIEVTQREFGPARVADVACPLSVRTAVVEWLSRRLKTPALEPKTILVLHGPCGCGKRALVRVASAACNAECIEGDDASAERSQLANVVHVCERVLPSCALPRSLFAATSPEFAATRPPDKKVYLFCGLDGMMSSSSSGASSSKTSRRSTNPNSDEALLAQVTALANNARCAPLVFTVQDFGTDALRKLRAHPRVHVVYMSAVTREAATRAVERLAATQGWPSSAVVAAMDAFAGDLRQALINAQEVALGQCRLFARDAALQTPFDTAKWLMNVAKPMKAAVLMEYCRAGYVDDMALRCVFQQQYVSVVAKVHVPRDHAVRTSAATERTSTASRVAPRLTVIDDDSAPCEHMGDRARTRPRLRACTVSSWSVADTADAWSWLDVTAPWNSVLRDELLAVPLAAMQNMRTADFIPSFQGRFDVRSDKCRRQSAWRPTPLPPEGAVGYTVAIDAHQREVLTDFAKRRVLFDDQDHMKLRRHVSLPPEEEYVELCVAK